MKQIILNIPENKFKFFMTPLKSLDFINTSENTKVFTLSDEQEEFVEDLKKSVQEVGLHLKGKIKLKNAKDILNEI